MSLQLHACCRRHAGAGFVLAAAALLAGPPVQAGEVYGQIGLPGVGLGYAQPLNSLVGLRADWVTLGQRHRAQREEGVDYAGKLKANRFALVADVFPFEGGFRVSAGVTSNDYKLELDASGAGRQVTVGNTTYTFTANDGYTVTVKFPRTTPYLGLGWGHHQATGLRFSADVGASFGRAKLTGAGRGQLDTTQGQADIDAELDKLVGGVGKIRFLPQISFAIGYAF